ncbi:hypothetical protein EG68_06904 [Paragonimus skrjabini miyazakii]|uniref:Ubiquitin-like domain-containing protein n=1 Tax=Paragonimus skrjabini miyazakii TaxID=59628 RepID=A0A8S9YMA2_9TREM|nr:hypothetical protein EG68_06904 [Paragonimus skrjabini miyazakii]
MEPASLPLVIKSPNDKVPTQNIQCDRVWSVKDLKVHLGESYPTQPDPTSLRLIHAGKLLKDDTPLATLFKDFSQPQTVHLVCRNQKVPEKSEDTSATSEDLTNDIPTDELEKYQRAYYEYLQQFYMNNSDIVPTSVNGAHAWPYANAHFTAPGLHYPQWDHVALANQPHAYWYYSGMTPQPSHAQNSPSTFTPPSSQPEAAAAANVAGGNRWFRGARAVLAGLGVMNNVEDGVAADANAAPAQQQQQAMLVGNPMGAGLMGAEDMGEDGGNMDIVDRFYMLFRLCLFIGLCFAYSSLDKAIIVFCVAAYVYFYNIYRRHAAIRQPLVQIPQVRANPVDRPQAAAEPSEPSADMNLAETSGQNRPEMDQLLNRRVVQNEQSNLINDQLPAPTAPEPRLSRFTSTIRLVATVSFQFVSSLIASLIPEQPPPIRLD